MKTTSQPIDPNAIIDAVCEWYDISFLDLVSKKRGRVSAAKAGASHLLYKHCAMSYPEIAHKLGRKSHGPFHSGAKRIKPGMPMLTDIMDRAQKIMEECNAN